MQLPPQVELSATSLEVIARDFGIQGEQVTRMSDSGIFNAIYRLGDHSLLRVPRNHPAQFEALEREAFIVPRARAAGIRTPELLRYDPSRKLLPAPYAVFELIGGTTLEPGAGHPMITNADAWSELGRDLAILHTKMAEEGLRTGEEIPEATELLAQRGREGWLSDLDVEWLADWLERLTGAAGEPHICATHGDIQATNVLVDDTGAYRALIDWGSAKQDDPACDFAGVPLRVVPPMLSGYQTAGGGASGMAARIVRRHLQLSLLFLPRGAVPSQSWAERPLPMLLEALHFFADPPLGWEDLGPVSPVSE
jgi:aminoglycoside phosphotransferase (APT) family kinase protein